MAVSLSVPDWARRAVWYQVFPDRFRNGDESNDPTPADLGTPQQAWPHVPLPDGWRPHPWTSDWYKLQPWERRVAGGFETAVFQRRYGGDIQGIIDRLDYLQGLGVTALYLNPVFQSPSLHKYDHACFHHVDVNFGPDPRGDRQIMAAEVPADPASWRWTAADRLFLRLVRDCHRRGMRIIVDGVFNHVGATFWAMNDVRKHGPASRFADWFTISSYDPLEYDGWHGVRDLPEIHADANGLYPESYRDHIHTIVRRWMAPDGDASAGIDGWRLDAAMLVPMAFWREFHGWVKQINPQAYLAGEIWWDKEQEGGTMQDASPYLTEAFHGVMNYRFWLAIQTCFITPGERRPATRFAEMFEQVNRQYGDASLQACMNMLDSHDTDRVASQLVNYRRTHARSSKAGENDRYAVRAPGATARARQRALIALQMTLPGAPMIYYGDEAGMWGATDPDCRKPMVWADKVYEAEATDPKGRKRKPDPISFDQALFDWYRKLITIRQAHAALAVGKVEFIKVRSPDDRILAFRRSLARESLTIVYNHSNKGRTVSLSQIYGTDVPEKVRELTDDTAIPGGGEVLNLLLRPYRCVILADTT